MEFYYRADIFEQYGLDGARRRGTSTPQVAEQLHTADPTKYLGTFSADGRRLVHRPRAAGRRLVVGHRRRRLDGRHRRRRPRRRSPTYWGDLVEQGVIDNKPMYTPEWNAALNDGTQVGWVSRHLGARASWRATPPTPPGKWKMAPMPQWDAGDDRDRQLGRLGHRGDHAVRAPGRGREVHHLAEHLARRASNLLVQDGRRLPGRHPGAGRGALRAAGVLLEPAGLLHDRRARSRRPCSRSPTARTSTSPTRPTTTSSARPPSRRRPPPSSTPLTAMQKITVDDLKNSRLHGHGVSRTRRPPAPLAGGRPRSTRRPEPQAATAVSTVPRPTPRAPHRRAHAVAGARSRPYVLPRPGDDPVRRSSSPLPIGYAGLPEPAHDQGQRARPGCGRPHRGLGRVRQLRARADRPRVHRVASCRVGLYGLIARARRCSASRCSSRCCSTRAARAPRASRGSRSSCRTRCPP